MKYSWRDLYVMIRRWSAEPGTATGEAMQGHRLWTEEAYLLADVVDVLQLANWQRSMSGRKSAIPKPKHVKRPGAKPTGTTLGKDPILISEFDVWWDSH